MSVPFILYVSIPQNKAKEIELNLIHNKLVACIQKINVDSSFIWRDKNEQLSETLFIMKTFEEKIRQIEDLLQEIHPYEIYEVVGVKMDYVNEKYLKWMKKIVYDE